MQNNYLPMDKHGIWSTFEVKPGQEAEVEAFLRECAEEISREPGTTTFFALKVGPGRYATFDTMGIKTQRRVTLR